jgi:hypothetical protein
MNIYIPIVNRLSRVYFLLIILFFSVNPVLQAQDGLQMNDLNLNDLSSFQQTTNNWQIASDVYMDLYERHHVQAETGNGILVNTSEGDSPQDIYTTQEHGDIDLELEFMMAKESNSGIYFQGRYELQMLDSWGLENPGFYDMGGIYEWWEDGEGVGGIPPRTNASRAPGLWQHLEVKFRAPRFNEDGDKIAHARLKEVVLNGVMIHRNVDLIHPTGGAVDNGEVNKAPLRFQGDHGPVAFRNIRYKTYHNEPVEFADLAYQYFEGEFESVDDLDEAALVSEGGSDKLTLDMLGSSSEFGLIYRGELNIQEAGDYYFDLRTDGGHLFTIGGDMLSKADDSNRRWYSDPVTVSLEAGLHDVEIIYFRGARGGRPALGLMVEGPDIELHRLHEPESLPVNQENIPFLVEPDREPIVMHGFMDMGDRIHTHTAAVGYPDGVNVAFDQNNGSLLKIWKGDFINASTMWIGRGGGNLSLNEEAAIAFNGAPSLAYLANDNQSWPDSLQQGTAYRLHSYQFADNNQLVFHYTLDHADVEDHFSVSEDGKVFNRSLIFKQTGSGNELFFRIAAGENIQWMPNNLYQVDDKSYFIRLNGESGRQAWIRSTGDNQELIIPVSDTDQFTLDYSYIW